MEPWRTTVDEAAVEHWIAAARAATGRGALPHLLNAATLLAADQRPSPAQIADQIRLRIERNYLRGERMQVEATVEQVRFDTRARTPGANIEESHHPTASALLAALRTSGTEWLPAGSQRTDWIFRGHRDASWPLVPSAWRQPGQRNHAFNQLVAAASAAIELTHDTSEWLPGALHCASTLLAEQTAIHNFAWLANRRGFALPIAVGPPPSVGAVLLQDDMGQINLAQFSASLHRLAPLAQHHGIPTRLLDWTLNPMVAACFMATDHLTEPRDDAGNMAIWALQATSILRPAGAEGPAIEVLDYPRHENQFMHAQDGVFTVIEEAESQALREARWPSLERDAIGAARLRKLTVPKAQAWDLFRMLTAEGLSPANLRPTLDGLVDDLRVSWTHTTPPEGLIAPV